MSDLSSLLPIANSLVITLGIGFVAFNQLRNNTIQILKDNIAAKDIEIAQMGAAHDAAIASLNADIKALSAQLESLKQANLVLQNTVTGRDTLMAIVEIMGPIPALLSPGGFIDEVRENQQKALKDLGEIRAALKATPTIVTPDHKKFNNRSPKLPPQSLSGRESQATPRPQAHS